MATILVVDDHSGYRKFLVTLLSRSGHRLLEALDGTEALAVARAHRPDLIIADILTSGMDGFEFVHQLRSGCGLTRTRVVFNTAHFFEREVTVLAHACGVSHVLAKPSDPEVILRSINEALDKPMEADVGPAPAALDDHLTLVMDKLSKKVEELKQEIGQRKQAEEAFDQANCRLRALFDNALDAIFFADDEGRFVDANPAACGLLCHLRDELLQMNANQIAIPPEPGPGEEVWRNLIGTGRMHGEFLVLRQDGVTREVEFQVVAHVLPALHLLVLRDVTDRKTAERALRDSEQRLRHLSLQLLRAHEEERRHIARELHDEIGGALTTTKFSIQAVLHAAQGLVSASLAQESIDMVDRILKQVRDLSLDLRPSLLDDLGLAAALRWCLDRQARRAGFSASFEAGPSPDPLLPEIEIGCFRVAQEALTNVARHAKASRVHVELRQQDRKLQLFVRDDGVGFDVQAARQRARQGASLGLLGMQERATLLGGYTDIDSVPSQGTEIRAFFPIPTTVPAKSEMAGERSS